MKKSVAFVLFFLCHLFVFGQVPIIETPTTKGKFEKDTDLIIENYSSDVKIFGNISTTTTTLVFRNNSNRIMEGRLTFPLPEGVSISGYALDINGKLRNAVPVEKERAREVFETIEKQRVDPGIIEKVEGNNFRTRIYPINPNATRSVQITYTMELKKNGNTISYYLPFDKNVSFPKFHLKISVNEKLTTPQLAEKPDGSFDFVKNANLWTAEISKENFQPKNDLRVAIPSTENNAFSVLQAASDNHFYFLSNMPMSASSKAKPAPSTIALVWDNSLSGTQRNHEKELEFLTYYFRRISNVKVNVYLLSNAFETGKSFTITNGNWYALQNYLQSISYDGGTDFSTIKPINADEVLLFSDGISSFGEMKPNFKQPVYSIVSSAKANFSAMKLIALKSGGELINLNQNSVQSEVKKALYQSLKFLGIKENPSVSEVYPSLPTAVEEHFSISGILKGNSTKITALFGYGSTVVSEKTIELNSADSVSQDWDISKFWAQKKITDLELFEKENSEEIKTIGQQFGIVTNNTSLMVLENLSDYVKYKITPPQELSVEYEQLTKVNRESIAENRKGIMENAERMIEDLKKWWKTDFVRKKKYPKPTTKGEIPLPRVGEENTGVVETFGNSAPPTPSAPSPNPRALASRQYAEETTSTKMEEVVARKLQGKVSGIEIPKAEIRTIDVKSDAEYMKFFEGKNVEEIYKIYLEKRADYIETPAYYFDVAKLLWDKKQKKLSLKVLSSIADLDLENEELYKLLMYKLKQYEIYDKELFVAKKILEWRPFDPQSYRDFALASEDNGLYQQALDNLYKVLTNTYTEQLANRDNGIEETILMEINELISKYPQLDKSKINPKLIADLPVNIRVAINWNKDNTDIDLWVTDPDGEKCMYSHKQTEIGGRLSDDFTGGFGPEQFLLKKAIKGKYKIETNFFGERQVSVAGPTAIMAEIFINYATGKQERKIVVFQKQKKSKQGNGDGVLIGKFEF